MSRERASTILSRAKGIISDPRDWNKGDYATYDPESESTRYCALGAVGAAMGLDPNINPDADLIVFGPPGKYLRLSVPVSRQSEAPAVIDYNDREATTHDDIMSLFDKAIALARQTEEVGAE